MSEKKYKKEFSFSFEQIGDRLNQVVGSLGNEEVKMASFSEPVEGVSSATVELHFSVGELTVRPLVASDNLIEADVTYVGELEFARTAGAEPVITLKQKSQPSRVIESIRDKIGSLAHRSDLRWDVRLSPDVPLRLKIDGGVGPSHLDLTGLNLTRVEVDGGVGENHLTLPDSDALYQAEVDGGVGATSIHLPADAPVKLSVDGGVGAVKMYVPEEAAVRITVDGGLGDVRVPEYFTQVKSKDEFISKSGVWETPNYNTSAKRIDLDYDGGVGSLTVIAE
jgi:hypothetical protein